ncbi:MlaD family protein [Luteolibacter luteus]|uniref:MCE family protein n=1 Tax=Luteolibacter luteus TaxID=2728835 RepID=A0A858RI57_9BACT|nr:MlaD family protein [Luteolibacter luteus]QJE96532.1 MCE family protein [Luteolibacter luteus]
MGESTKRTELWVGVFVFIGLALLGGLIVQFGRFGDRMRGKYQLVVVFDDASGVIKGSEIRMGGARIGKVADQPELNSEVKVQVTLSIDDPIRIPENSMIQIASATLLGDKMVVITPPEGGSTTGRFIQPGAVLRGGGPSGLDAIQNNAEAVSRDARRLMQEAESTFLKLDSAVDDIRIVTGRMADTLEKVNESILSEKNLQHVDSILANLDNASADWAKASASLDPTIGDARKAIQSIEKAAASADDTMARAGKRIDELEPALKEVPKAVSSISRAADKAGAALDRVESGEGLLGTLAYDREVSDDAKTFIRNLKQQGILRYRDKETPEEDPRNRFRGRRR